MIPAYKVRKLREVSGEGLTYCLEALNYSGGDLVKAFAYLKYHSCAVYVKPIEGQSHEEARKIWLKTTIESYVEKYEQELLDKFM